jgi:hypothetical protein
MRDPDLDRQHGNLDPDRKNTMPIHNIDIYDSDMAWLVYVDQEGFNIFYVLYSILLLLPPLRFHCVGDSEDAGIESKTVATLTLAVKSSNHSARTRLRY